MSTLTFSQIKHSIVAQFSQDRADANKTVPFIMGAPGGGKSAAAREALRELGFDESNTVEFVASLRDPVDVLVITPTPCTPVWWCPAAPWAS